MSTGARTLSYEVLTVPADDPRHLPNADADVSDGEEAGDDGQPRWVHIDLVGIGVLPLSIWETIDDAIDAQCKEEDKRRRKARKPGGSH